jgi:hypothetical protein
MTISALIFAVLACGCAVMTNVTCNFVRVKTPGNVLNDDLFPSNFEAQTGRLGIGLWNFEDYLNNDHDGHYYSSCIMFNNTTDDFLDDKWKAARSMSVVANACLGISVLSCFAMMCLALPNFFFKFVAALLFLGCLCESLVFIVFASDMCNISDCQFSSGAGTAVAASVLALFAVSCVPTNILKPNDEPEAFVPGTGEQVHSNEAGTATAVVKTTVEPNGTTKTITSTVNADGSLEVVRKKDDAQVAHVVVVVAMMLAIPRTVLHILYSLPLLAC